MEEQIEKLRFILSDAVPAIGAVIKPLRIDTSTATGGASTSIQIIHTCGCVLTQHIFCDQLIPLNGESRKNYLRRQVEREYFVELCPLHAKQFARGPELK